MHRMYTVRGTPGITTKITVSDTARTLTDAGMSVSLGGKNAIGALVTVDNSKISTAHIRCTFGDPDSVAPTIILGHIMFAGDSIYLDNPLSVRTFQFINSSVANNAVMHITLEYEVGSGVTV